MAGLGLVGLPLSHLAIIFSALSVGIGFGLQTMVNNLVSGLILLGERSIRVGDFIALPSGEQGMVEDISMRSTRIRTPDGTLILMPNSVLVEGSVRNLSALDAAHRQRFDFSVGYGTSKEAVRDAIAAAARAVPATLEDAAHPIEVALKDLGDVTLDFQLVVWVRNATLMEPYRTRSAYLSAIDDTITRCGFPQPNPGLRRESEGGGATFRVVGDPHDRAPAMSPWKRRHPRRYLVPRGRTRSDSRCGVDGVRVDGYGSPPGGIGVGAAIPGRHGVDHIWIGVR